MKNKRIILYAFWVIVVPVMLVLNAWLRIGKFAVTKVLDANSRITA